MNLPDLDPTHSPEVLFGDILAYVEQAEALVKNRETVMLAGLDTAIDALCQRISTLTPAAAREYAPELEHLLARITQMQGHMIALQDNVLSTLKSLGTQKKAVHAYSNAPTGMVEE